ncbi:MAG TPA: hypothetical protein VKN99_03190 [Polyangia bacterium]|nr:hypothetical protein [Polyangia bacterium]
MPVRSALACACLGLALGVLSSGCSGKSKEEPAVRHPAPPAQQRPPAPVLGGLDHHPHTHLSPHEVGDHHHHPHPHPHLFGPNGHHHPY